MLRKTSKFLEKFRQYHFEFKHLLVLLIVLIFFQILASIIHKSSLKNLLLNTQNWYQQDSAERMANLSATSLELLLETSGTRFVRNDENIQEIVKAFNIILSQPLLQQSVRDICVLVSLNDQIYSIDDGHQLYDYFFNGMAPLPGQDTSHAGAIRLYRELQDVIQTNEQIYSVREGNDMFHVFVPFVPKGEYMGAVYVKNNPDFTFITSEIISSYDQTALLFAALILLGLIAMFYISSYTVKERDEALHQLYSEREKRLMEEINHQKEALFTKRIYHTHHKAEKVMGFIKEDLRQLGSGNRAKITHRVAQYANFISRVIYDMKWYDPPLQTIRNPLFRTDLNNVLEFIVGNIFMRVSDKSTPYNFKLSLDKNFPPLAINEFVIWEIVEPLIQNSIDHGGNSQLLIRLKTSFDPEKKIGQLTITDNGKGIIPELLEPNPNGIKKIFQENISTKVNSSNSGYGCYLAYEISKQRCGWNIDAENLAEGGCRFIITIPY
jgi:hypothetical protein